MQARQLAHPWRVPGEIQCKSGPQATQSSKFAQAKPEQREMKIQLLGYHLVWSLKNRQHARKPSFFG
jgi:hypothetical protein